MQSPGIAMFQGPAGRMPPTMASHSLFMERFGGDTSVPLLNGGAVNPGELIRATATGIGSFIDPTITFELFDADGTMILQAKKSPSLTSRQVSLNFNAPTVEGTYTVRAWLDNLPFLPFQHEATTTFQVKAGTPVQDPPPSGGGGILGGFNLGDLKPLAWIVLGIVAIMAVTPVVKRVTGSQTYER